MAGGIRRMKPLFDRVLVQKPESITKTASGILLPENTKASKLNEGVVIAVGEGAYTSDGKVIAMRVKVGDRVLLPEFGGTPVKIEKDQEHVLLRQDDILAVFMDEKK
eukprot:TRINITY_DN3804_c0_g1_i1.p1 TRINITY_DN3804_c0_g1~~TRINITY_DN3804_c0_g1_i1.p1  ORF type:complete len:120 (-),score=23.53 TRINITY_DN3804_c0_g1_i1:21-341(-)